METVEEFLEALAAAPESIRFADTMTTIDTHYRFTPVAFKNGDVTNAEGENQGSCKILAFGRLHNLSQEATLACFGEVYRIDVLALPEGDNHPNIRSFMQYGWGGVDFSGNSQVLEPKPCSD